MKPLVSLTTTLTVEQGDHKPSINIEQANINDYNNKDNNTNKNNKNTPNESKTNTNNNTTYDDTIPLGSIVSASLDNLNVIYDNETTIVELMSSKSTDGEESREAGPKSTQALGKNRNSSNVESGPSRLVDGFINSEHGDEMERENHATCRLEPTRVANNKSDQWGLISGQLNFWQPINNGGVLHLVARVRYSRKRHVINKRESFRAPIERPPLGGVPFELEASRLRNRHQIWLVDGCHSNEAVEIKEPVLERQLLAELVPSVGLHAGNKTNNETGSETLVNLDAELIVAQFNLTGTNEIAKKYLSFQLPDGQAIACCQITMTDNLPNSELDSLASVSMIQPVREDLLPDRLRKPTADLIGS